MLDLLGEVLCFFPDNLAKSATRLETGKILDTSCCRDKGNVLRSPEVASYVDKPRHLAKEVSPNDT